MFFLFFAALNSIPTLLRERVHTLSVNKSKLGPVVHYEDKVNDDNDADAGDDDKGSATCVSLSPSRS